MTFVAKLGAKARLKNKDLALYLIDITEIESAVTNIESPNIEIINREMYRLIANGLKVSRWAVKASTKTTATTLLPLKTRTR